MKQLKFSIYIQLLIEESSTLISCLVEQQFTGQKHQIYNTNGIFLLYKYILYIKFMEQLHIYIFIHLNTMGIFRTKID